MKKNSSRNTLKIKAIKDLGDVTLQYKLVYAWKYYKFPIIIFIVALLATYPYSKIQNVEKYPKVNDVSQETIISPFTYNVEKSDSLYQLECKKAEKSVIPVYRLNRSIKKKVLLKVDSLDKMVKLFSDTIILQEYKDSLYKVYNLPLNINEVEKLSENLLFLRKIKTVINNAISSGVVSHVPLYSLKDVENLKSKYDSDFDYIITSSNQVQIIIDTTEKSVNISNLYSIPNIYITLFSYLDKNSENYTVLASALYRIVNNFIIPNLEYDPIETQIRRSNAVEKVSKILRTIPKNVEIVRKHQRVTPAIEQNLQTLRQIYDSQATPNVVFKNIVVQVASIFLILILAVVITFHLIDCVPKGVSQQTYYYVVSITVAISFAIIRFGTYVTKVLTPDSSSLAPSLIHTAVPMVVAPLLLSALFNKQTGFLITIIVSVYSGIAGGYDPIIPIGVLISGGIISQLASSMRYRKDFIYMILWIAVTSILTGVTMTLVDSTLDASTFEKIIFFSFTNAIASISFAFILFPIFEHFFKLTTDMTLVELSDMNHPLLKQLAIKAPGTYNHSVMVATLAESAAEAIGADGLLCRVVSYYHDIGKLKRPQNFIENQGNGKKNIHDRITPIRSVKIITDHVKDGLELAEEYGLPQAIKDVIPQHHGDSTLTYFYHKALQEKGDSEEIDPSLFTYHGPKPQTRENAIVMIADSVEAASRTMKEVTIKDIRELVKKIIATKFSQEQLIESGLNLSDLSGIINGMMPILEGIFHSRIEYPDDKE